MGVIAAYKQLRGNKVHGGYIAGIDKMDECVDVTMKSLAEVKTGEEDEGEWLMP